jgi:multidrug efflux pump subunit AcrA (membrane-fusion protein)
MRTTLVILLAVAAAACAALIPQATWADNAAPTDAGRAEAEAPESSDIEPSSPPAEDENLGGDEGAVTTKVLRGIIRANKSVRLGPINRGIVAEVNKEKGDEVKEGDVLARLRYDRAEVEYKRAEISVELSRAEKELAALELEYYAREYNNLRRLRFGNDQNDKDNPTPLPNAAATQDEVDEAEQNMKRAEANHKIKQGELKMTQEALKYRNIDLEDTKIISPIKGIVTQKLIEIGEMFEPNNYKPMFEVIDIDVVKVFIYLPLEFIPKVSLGDVVRVRVELSGVLYEGEGKVAHLATTIDAGSDTMLAEIEVPNPEHKIKVGLRAEVTFCRPERKDTGTKEPVEE